MRFLFVSRITKMTQNKVSGTVSFGPGEPWRYVDHAGETRVSVSVISEAIGQLVSWLSLHNTDFFGRPVFLFASKIDLSNGVAVGETVELEAEITNESSESFVFSGRASVNGQTIAKIEDCGGYLMPLAELEDPEVTRKRLKVLLSEGFAPNPAADAFEFSSLVDRVSACTTGESITTEKTFAIDERFYPDHFPRFPVTPIVVINEMIGYATSKMMSSAEVPVRLVPLAVQDLKIRSFIKPGDTAVVSVKKTESVGREFETIAEITVAGRRILRGRYRYCMP